ncbi:hypothetical protein CDL60_07090 [Roseateles noduli]|nr:hypothetical protein CDL60_07090 [Roseateles noduli]
MAVFCDSACSAAVGGTGSGGGGGGGGGAVTTGSGGGGGGAGVTQAASATLSSRAVPTVRVEWPRPRAACAVGVREVGASERKEVDIGITSEFERGAV